MQTTTERFPDETVNTAAPDGGGDATEKEKTEGDAGNFGKAEKEGEGKPEKEEKSSKKELKALKKELEAAETKLKDAEAKQKEQEDKYLRMLAEYDNFRRRAREEKDAAYAAAAADVLGSILPVIDNLERAAGATGDADSVRKGVQMTLNQFVTALDRLGITEVPCDHFDPTLHNAVMHVEDEEKGEGEIVEVLQKGYKRAIKSYAMLW